MNQNDSEDHQQLRQISRQVTISVWLSTASLFLLLFVLLFPRQAEGVSQASVAFQDWIGPQVGGIIGIIFSLIIVYFAAAYVLSHILPKSPSDLENSSKQNQSKCQSP